MKFVVTIDRRTFKRNPNSNSTSTIVNGNKIITLTVRGPHHSVGENLEEGWMLTDYKSENGTQLWSTYVCSGDNSLKKLIETLLKNGVNLSQIQYEINQQVYEVKHLPKPDFIFKYNDIEVCCRRCRSKFLSSKLESDYVVYVDGILGDAFSNTICPKCGEWDCCELEFENPEDVAKELGL